MTDNDWAERLLAQITSEPPVLMKMVRASPEWLAKHGDDCVTMRDYDNMIAITNSLTDVINSLAALVSELVAP